MYRNLQHTFRRRCFCRSLPPPVTSSCSRSSALKVFHFRFAREVFDSRSDFLPHHRILFPLASPERRLVSRSILESGVLSVPARGLGRRSFSVGAPIWNSSPVMDAPVAAVPLAEFVPSSCGQSTQDFTGFGQLFRGQEIPSALSLQINLHFIALTSLGC
jgi:hypothetical protein